MIRIISTILFLFILGNCYCQDTITVHTQKKDWKEEQIKLKIIEREAFVTKYVDSLNSYKNNGNCELPYFFTCENFDQKHGSKFWVTMHSAISVRKLIIDRIDNYELLWCVEKKEDKRLLTKDTSKTRCLHCKIPFDQFSNRDLVGFRLDELMNKKNLTEN